MLLMEFSCTWTNSTLMPRSNWFSFIFQNIETSLATFFDGFQELNPDKLVVAVIEANKIEFRKGMVQGSHSLECIFS